MAWQVCKQIKTEQKIPGLLRMAEKRGWPRQVDWKKLPTRIQALSQDHIQPMVANAGFLEGSSSWKTFLETLQIARVKFIQFSQLSTMQTFGIVGHLNHAG